MLLRLGGLFSNVVVVRIVVVMMGMMRMVALVHILFLPFDYPFIHPGPVLNTDYAVITIEAVWYAH